MNAPSTVARFTQGSILRHVIIMTLTGALGLMAFFIVDLADLYFLSLLKDTNITAAIGVAGTLGFANLSLSLGTGIAAAALVARNVGARQPERAKQFATSTLAIILAISTIYTVLTAIFAEPLLSKLGAKDEALHLAKLFIWTLSPGFIMLAFGVGCSFVLRGIGDAKRAMYVTLAAAITTVILDPIFIFQFGWGIQGTAAANVVADAVAAGVGIYGLFVVHKFYTPFSMEGLKRDLQPIFAIAFPMILTQLATPFTLAFTNYVTAPYGNDALTASAIVGRLVPVAFGVIFSLSGAVGPIIGQNFGALNFERVKSALHNGLIFAFAYTLVTSLILFLLKDQIVQAFHATGRTAELVIFFCSFIAITWAFAGSQFVSNAAFNNLGKASYSTWTNWGKATVGTIPFALIGAHYAGPEGIMAGTGLGSIAFGILSVIIAYRLANKVAEARPTLH